MCKVQISRLGFFQLRTFFTWWNHFPSQKNIFSKNLLLSFWIKDMHMLQISMTTNDYNIVTLYTCISYAFYVQERWNYMFDSLGKSC